MHLHTSRLTLIAATPAHLRAELTALASPPAEIANHPLAALLKLTMPEYWPPDLFEADDMERSLATLADHPDQPGWGLWYLAAAGRLIGIAGFDGPPGEDGAVVLGYSLLPSARNRGLATEAAQALIAWAFQDERVHLVQAETLPNLVPSIRVLEKCGFSPVTEARTPGAIAFELRRE
jgi:RimJ/RimL family protein N-acetyltransferase